MTKVGLLEGPVQAVEENLEALRAAPAPIANFTADGASLTKRNKQAIEERNTLPTRICQVAAAAMKRN